MTREKQIEREALLDYDAYADNNYHAFKRGVAWADENPKEGFVSIDKVCEWLENECDIKDYLGGIFSGPCSINFDFEKLSNNLRKAMDE